MEKSKSLESKPAPVATTAAVIKRKPRASALSKYVRKMKTKIFNMSLPAIRYSMMPGLIIFAIYYTEPSITLSELLNPFY